MGNRSSIFAEKKLWNVKRIKIMKNVLKKCLKKVVVIFIYTIVFVPNFIIGFIQGFKGKVTNRPA